MMKFRCKRCGQRIAVPESHAGKEGKCPKCKAIITVPKPQTEDARSEPADTDRPKADSEPSPYDLTLVHLPPAPKAEGQPTEQTVVDDAAYKQLRRLQGGSVTLQSDQIPQRTLPWILDIFLYPLSKPGLTIIAISVGIPLTLRILAKTFGALTLIFRPMLIFFVVFIIAHWASLTIFLLYIHWYVCECIRDSAVGGIRAPETVGSTPGLWDIFRQTLKFVSALVFFMSPAVLYFNYTQRVDWIVLGLYGGGGFLFPMGLLAVVMFDSLRGLTPRLVIGSILSTLFQYCGLVIFCYGLFLLIPIAGYFLRRVWIMGYLFLLFCFYQALILAHLLGRFFWKYEEKLNWEV